MELKWKIPDFNVKLIVRLGGLHISMSFLKTIGKHMAGSGLYEAWIESGLLGEGAAELVFSGKVYSKAMRTHKITVQALWRILNGSLRTGNKSILIEKLTEGLECPQTIDQTSGQHYLW